MTTTLREAALESERAFCEFIENLLEQTPDDEENTLLFQWALYGFTKGVPEDQKTFWRVTPLIFDNPDVRSEWKNWAGKRSVMANTLHERISELNRSFIELNIPFSLEMQIDGENFTIYMDEDDGFTQYGGSGSNADTAEEMRNAVFSHVNKLFLQR